MSTIPTNDEQLRAEVCAHSAQTELQVFTEQPIAESCCGPLCCIPSTPAVTTVQKSAIETSACCGPSCCSTTEASGSSIVSDLSTQME